MIRVRPIGREAMTATESTGTDTAVTVLGFVGAAFASGLIFAAADLMLRNTSLAEHLSNFGQHLFPPRQSSPK